MAAVVAIVAVAAVSQRIAVAAPLSMVIVGIALSFLAGLPEIEVNPEWILAGALPPLLYATAVHVPAQWRSRSAWWWGTWRCGSGRC